jgi:hypothetical protein
MNIKELMAWRQDCFFCHEDLTIFPEVGGLDASFSIENDLLHMKSKYVNLSVHVVTGEVVETEDQDKVTIDEFLKRSSLKITAKCLNCEGTGRFYSYYGTVSLMPFTTRSTDISLFREEVMIINDWIFSQNKVDGREWGAIKTFKVEIGAGPPSVVDILSRESIRTPFLDLKKLTPERLENKLKTYIVFS